MRSRSALSLLTAVGVLLSVGVLVGCDSDLEPSSEPETSVTLPAPAPTPSTRTPAPSPFADLSRGDPPDVGYVRGRLHVAPDGARTRLPVQHEISEIARFDGGFLVADAGYFEGTNGLVMVENGRVEEIKPCASGAGAASSDGSEVAWATFACPESGVPASTILHRSSAEGTKSQEIPMDIGNPLTSVA